MGDLTMKMIEIDPDNLRLFFRSLHLVHEAMLAEAAGVGPEAEAVLHLHAAQLRRVLATWEPVFAPIGVGA